MGPGPRARWRPGARRTWSARWSRSPSASRPARRRRSGTVWPTGELAGPASGAPARPTAGPGRRRRSWTTSAPAGSTCWSPPPSSRSASTCPTPRSWSSKTPSASGSPSSTSYGAASAAATIRRGATCSAVARTRRREERLGALERSTDGFELAEVDLELRGEGTILGTRQKGAHRSQAGLPAARQGPGGDGPRGGVRPGRRGPGAGGVAELAAEIRLLVDDEDQEFLFKG